MDAILLTSARAVRPGDPALAALLHLPVHAVGPATAEAARAAGFAAVHAQPDGGAASLLARIAALPSPPRRLLHLAGRERTSAEIPPGLEILTRETYAAELAPLRPEAAAALAARTPPLTLLYSVRTARQFAAEVARLALPRARLPVAALSPAILAAAGPGWAQAIAPPTTSESALFTAAGLSVPASC